jgi:hypothetical protein
VPVTVVAGRQRVTVHEPDAPTDGGVVASDVGPDITWEECLVGRGGRSKPAHLALGNDPTLSRQAVAVRCADGGWWQARRAGTNGIVVRCANGATIPVGDDWVDVPARYGEAYVTVTTPTQEHDFKVEPGASGTSLSVAAGGIDEPTRMVGEHGYWRVAVALCEPMLADGSDRMPTHGEIAARLDRLGLEQEGFGTKAVEKRIGHLYRVTGIEPGRAAARLLGT